MSHFFTSFHPVAVARHRILRNAHRQIIRAITKLKPRQQAKSDISYLAEFSDAELADIGLLRAELYADPADDAIDTQAQAMLRIYR